MKAALRIEGLRTPEGVLRDVHLALEPGGRAAILGPTGVGKSLLAAALFGEISCAGRIELFGRDSTRATVSERAQAGLRLVPQRRDLFAALTVAENLELGAWGRSRAERRARTDAVLARFALLEARLRTPAEALSGGERQLLAIARALMSRPRALILDEPEAGLAPAMAQAAAQAVEALVAPDGVVLVLEQAPRFATRLGASAARLEGGRVVLQPG